MIATAIRCRLDLCKRKHLLHTPTHTRQSQWIPTDLKGLRWSCLNIRWITGWWFQSLWKILVIVCYSYIIGMMTFPIYGKIKVMIQSAPTRSNFTCSSLVPHTLQLPLLRTPHLAWPTVSACNPTQWTPQIVSRYLKILHKLKAICNQKLYILKPRTETVSPHVFALCGQRSHRFCWLLGMHWKNKRCTAMSSAPVNISLTGSVAPLRSVISFSRSLLIETSVSPECN